MKLKIVLSFIIFTYLNLGSSCEKEELFDFERVGVNGISLEAPQSEFTPVVYDTINQIGANWVAIMPYAFLGNNSTELIYNIDRMWWGETKAGVISSVEMAHQKGLKVMIKPHIWLRYGKYTGELKFESDNAWEKFENSYTDYILFFAQLADSLNCELYCIGNELRSFTTNRTSYWISLVSKVRSVYQGQITYAANWDEYKYIGFWKLLDYIGVNAYFPLSSVKVPTVKNAREGWFKHRNELKLTAQDNKKHVLFTEYGYRSVEFTCKEPWNSYEDFAINNMAQKNALEALYKEFWEERWFAGGFLWKWHVNFNYNRNKDGYSPQQKSALQVVKEYYRGSTSP
ncbi:MAG: hypothetical protein MI922_06440 [Bacteroidales bacterium]|nr:hypothetical protein [Bacteroidales bacterium]